MQAADLAKGKRVLHVSPTSEVYVTELAATSLAVSAGTQVAVKRTKITGPGDKVRFEKELALLGACAHPSVIVPIGVLVAPPTYALVLPLFAHGALFTLLHASGRTLTPAAKLGLGADIAGALCHLHERGVLHRDVKTDNVLVGANGRGVLTDFNAAEWQSEVTSDIVTQARPTGGERARRARAGPRPCAACVPFDHGARHAL